MVRSKKDKAEPTEELKDAAAEAQAPAAAGKRKADDAEAAEAKRQKSEDEALIAQALASDVAGANVELVPAAKEGQSFFTDQDVLSGRGGGTNVHPGNRRFRDLINVHRRAYLKARKNDKPSISRSIVRQIRATGGKFLKKDEKTGLWFEVGDDAAREKTSQALRQRAPEMRKLLFDTEREEARLAAQEHLRQQRLLMGLPADGGDAGALPPGMPPMPPGLGFPPFPFPPPLPPGGKLPPMPLPNSEQYRQMFGMFMQGGFPNLPGMPPFPMSPPGEAPSGSEPAKAEPATPIQEATV